jgi:hypothetical protein
MAEMPRVTVAIPLHRGRRWAENVLGNIARLRGHARILVSDAHEHDDALSHLRARVGDCDDVRFAGRRDLPAGWVPHYNDLMRQVTTPLMMWLPQDDEIDAHWVVGGEEALRAAPDAVLATGIMRAVEEDGCDRAGLTVVGSPRMESADRYERIAAAAEFLCRDWGPIGLPFRGVFRLERAFPLQEARPAGEWADILWLLGMVARGPFATTPGAVYGKRFYRASEHVWWSSLARSPQSVPLIVGALHAALGRDDLPAVAAAWRGDRAALLALLAHSDDALAAWAEEADSRSARIEVLENQLDAVRATVAEHAARSARADARAREAEGALAVVFASRSWRLTAPIRRFGASVRSLRGR